MRIQLVILCLFTMLLGVQCGEQEATTTSTNPVVNTDEGSVLIAGQLQGAGGISAYLDKVQLNSNSNSVLDKTTVEGDGSFSFSRPKGESGVYRIRLGTKTAFVLLSGNESAVNLTGDLATVDKYDYSITGSNESEVYQKVVKHFVDNPPNQETLAKDFSTFIDTTNAPIAGMLVCMQVLDLTKYPFPNPEEILDIHKSANTKAVGKYGNESYIQEYSAYIQQVTAFLSSQLVRVGALAPDIDLPDPNGKSYKLSDLKGKVVLLDFWASWCRPCRMNNPHVVSIYKKYKNKGFTVYSVSLDGVDQRLKNRLSPDQLKQREAQQKDRWENAIQEDNLTWDYHVSDLKFWQCEPAKAYGVSSIPRTFLLDRDGRIAAINPRGAALEAEVKKLL